MNIFSWLFDSSESSSGGPMVNPANGLPMVNAAIDVAGNPFGTDYATSTHDTGSIWDSGPTFDSVPSWDSGSAFDSDCGMHHWD